MGAGVPHGRAQSGRTDGRCDVDTAHLSLLMTTTERESKWRDALECGKKPRAPFPKNPPKSLRGCPCNPIRFIYSAYTHHRLQLHPPPPPPPPPPTLPPAFAGLPAHPQGRELVPSSNKSSCNRIQKISVPISDTKKAPLTHRSKERGISEPERECTLWSRLVVLRGRGSSTSVHCGFETGWVILLVRAGLGRGLSDGSQPGCQLAPLFKGYSNVRLQQWAHSMTSLFVKIDYFK